MISTFFYYFLTYITYFYFGIDFGSSLMILGGGKVTTLENKLIPEVNISS